MTSKSNRGIIAALSILAGAVLIALMVAAAAPGLFGFGDSTSNAVRIGGPFTLTDQTGKAVSEQDLTGKPSIVFFGYTHCPDVCPTTLFEITQILDALKQDAGKVNALFISVDPERDTSQHLALYLSSFHERIQGLTGSGEEIARVAKSYRIYYKKVATGGDDYTMDHTALVFLMDKRGEFVAPLNIRQEPEKAAEQVRKLL